jgi:hypothetical protein
LRGLVARGLADDAATAAAARRKAQATRAREALAAKQTYITWPNAEGGATEEEEDDDDDDDDDDEGWEGAAFKELRAGLFEAHAIRPRDVALALGAAAEGAGAAASSTVERRWRALLRQVKIHSQGLLCISFFARPGFFFFF